MKEYIVIADEEGTKWFQANTFHGTYHRDEGPAIEYIDGSKAWYQYGELHREDGPAMELSGGEKSYFLNDQQYSEEEYYKEIADRASYLDDTIVLYGKKYKLVEEK